MQYAICIRQYGSHWLVHSHNALPLLSKGAMRYRCWLEWLLSLVDNIFGTSATVRISHLSITNTSSFSMYGKVDSPLRMVTWKNHNSDHHRKNELNLVGPCAAKVIEIVQRKVQLFQSCPSLKVLNSLLWPKDLCLLMETCARVTVGTVVNKFLPRPVKCFQWQIAFLVFTVAKIFRSKQ